MKFNNLNLTSNKASEFTKEDVTSEHILKEAEKIDYKVIELGRNVNAKESTNTAFNFKYIPREKLKFNPKNDFEMCDIADFSSDLLNIGMQHNLSAFYDDDQDCYVLESGERRLRACDMLFQKYGDGSSEESDEYKLYEVNIKPFFDKGFPVNVNRAKHQNEEPEHQQLDVIESELRKYKANIDVRELTPQKRAGYIAQVKLLMEERSRILHGDNAVSPTQAEVAKAVGTSERQLRKYSALDSLIPALRAEFESGNISINRVPGIAALPEDEQLIFLDLLQKGKNIDPTQVKVYQEHSEAANKARMAAEAEKERLEEELEYIKQTKVDEIASIRKDSQQREACLRNEIAEAEKEKNEELIIQLQNDLEDEKKSSDRLITEVQKSLALTQRKLGEAEEKIKEYSQGNGNLEKAIRIKTELDIQISMLSQTAARVAALFNNYTQTVSVQEAEAMKDEIFNSATLGVVLDLMKGR